MPSFSRASLRTKIVGWAFVPTTLILAAVALVVFLSYQRATANLVIERDEQLTRLSAAQLTAGLAEYVDVLADVARAPGIRLGEPEVRRTALASFANRLSVFDGGVLLLDGHGVVVAAVPERPSAIGVDWSGRDYYRELVRSHIGGAGSVVVSDVVPDGLAGSDAVVFALPVIGPGEEFLGSVLGMFEIGPASTSALLGSITKLRIGESAGSYLVDASGRVLYHSDSTRIGADFAAQRVVARVLDGEVGAERTRNVEGDDIVAAFAPVPGTPWGLVTQERWSTLTADSQRLQRVLVALLVLGVAIPAGIVSIGLRRIMQPVRALTAGAGRIASGDFDFAVDVATGDEIETLAARFNEMAGALRASYAELEDRVEARTRELAESEERVRAVVTGSPIVLFATDEEGVFTFSEGRGLAALGLRPGEVVGLSVFDVYRDEPDIQESVRRAIAGEEISAVVELGDLVFETLYSPLRDASGSVRGVVGVATDITEVRQAEESLRDMAIIEERNRMAREIHDTLAQGFTGILVQLEAGDDALARGSDDAREHLERARALARESLAAARRSVWDLVPHQLEGHTLEEALAEELRRVAEDGFGAAPLEVVGTRRTLPARTQAALLRVAQESLTNVRRHAGPSTVRVRLEFCRGRTDLRVEDDGAGFDVDRARSRGRGGGFGLRGMEQRVTGLGGTLRLTSAAGAGTRVEVSIPEDGTGAAGGTG